MKTWHFRPIRSTTAKLIVLVVGIVVLGCSAGPDKRLEECQERASAGETLEQMADCFTEQSLSFLVALEGLESETDGTLNYLEDSEQLLDVTLAPDVEPDITGNLAMLRTTDGHAVILIQEDGEWRIDALELERFWQPLVEAWETE